MKVGILDLLCIGRVSCGIRLDARREETAVGELPAICRLLEQGGRCRTQANPRRGAVAR
jgi:hypothetical protein